MTANLVIYGIVLLATAGVIIRPWHCPEYVWAISGAALLVIGQLITPSTAWTGARKGTDVYLFLTGMMLLAETARAEGLFDWLAMHATRLAGGSATKLFILVYLVGTVVTAFMSNDATVVVLTPAVAAAVKTAKVDNPLPYLFICAFIANAASFILPISNPANLVIYGSHLPPLLLWLKFYAIPAGCAVAVTFLMLWLAQRKHLRVQITTDLPIRKLLPGGQIALLGIVCTVVLLTVASAFNWFLGLPTAVAGLMTALLIVLTGRRPPVKLISQVSWGVLPLVAGLFVLVEALNQVGLITTISHLLQSQAHHSPVAATWLSGAVNGFGCNLVNNLPAGLIAGSAMAVDHLPAMVKSATLIGIDLGPNLSVTGSLATILWLTELRRNGHSVSGRQFLQLGAVVMVPALIAAIFALWI